MNQIEKRKITKLLKDLVSIPSYRDGVVNETLVTDFLAEYIATNMPWMSVKTEKVEGNRLNIFVCDAYPTKLLVIDHTDTVMPSKNWETDPCKPLITNGNMYGLGSSDTKGNIAAFLSSLKDFGETKGIAILLYADEEYDFKGMKSFISSPTSKLIDPEYICSIDGNGVNLGLGCRGLIEVKVRIKGEVSHSASGKGVSVNRAFIKVMGEVDQWVEQFSDTFFGKPSFNIARINSGAIEEISGSLRFCEEGNKIPDYLEAILEIRTTSDKLTGQTFSKFLINNFHKNGITEVEIDSKHDLAGYKTSLQNITTIQKAIADDIKGYMDPGSFGYLDVAMLRQVFPQSKIFSLGIGTIGQAHNANEYIELENLFRGYDVYKKILTAILGK